MERCNTLADLTESAEHAAACRLARGVYAVLPAVPFVNNGWRDQIERAATSVVCNVGEGYGRDTPTQMIQFLRYAKGSLFEVAALLAVAPVPAGDLGEAAAETARLIDAAILRADRRRDVGEDGDDGDVINDGRAARLRECMDDIQFYLRKAGPVTGGQVVAGCTGIHPVKLIWQAIHMLIHRGLVFRDRDKVLRLAPPPVGVGEQEGGHGRAGD